MNDKGIISMCCVSEVDRGEKTFKLKYPNGFNYNSDELITQWNDLSRLTYDQYIPA